MGVPILPDAGILPGLLLRLVLDLAFTAFVIRIYARHDGERQYVFTYGLLNVVTFAIAFLLSKIPIQLGFAVGLFGVFGILRYRTEPIPVRDLTYLFSVIGLALLNALGHQQISLVEVVVVNVLVAGAVVVLEAIGNAGRENQHQIVYDRLDLLAPESSAQLLADLRQRTRLPVTRYRVGDVDLLRDTAAITVYYPSPLPARRRG